MCPSIDDLIGYDTKAPRELLKHFEKPAEQ
jgi:hypothetical protein